MELRIIYKIISVTSALMGLVPVFFALYRFKSLNIQLKAVLLYLLICLLTDLTSYLTIEVAHRSNYFVYHIFTLIEGPLILFIYYKEFNFKKNNYIFIIAILLILVCGISQFSFTSPNYVASSLEAIIISGFAVGWFFKVFVDMNIPRLTAHYFFWVNSGLLIYFLGPFFIFIFEATIRESDSPVLNFLWIIHVLIGLLFYTVLTIGICRIKRK